MMRLLPLLLAAAALSACADEVGFQDHGYVDPKGVSHRGLHVARYARGLFWGSCGPSTRSLEWEFDLDLAGPGPRYAAADAALTDGDLKKVPLSGGTADFDEKAGTLRLALTVPGPGGPAPYAHDGDYRRSR